MKWIIPLLLTMALMHSACKKESAEELIINKGIINFGYSDNEETVTLSTSGEEEITWTLSTSSSLLEFSSSTGTCKKNQPSDFMVRVKRELVHSDSIVTSVRVAVSNGKESTIEIRINGFPEKKYRLNDGVYQASFDTVKDRLLLLMDTYPTLLAKFDLSGGDLRTIDLQQGFDQLSLSPGGGFAACGAGSGSRITLVDIDLWKVNKLVSVNEFGDGLVLTDNLLCWFFPYWTNDDIGYVNFQDETISTYSFPGYLNINRAFLNRAATAIYCAGDYSLYKIRINTPEPSLIYTYSDSNPGQGIWLNTSGTRMITGNSDVLYLDPDAPFNDITGQAEIALPQTYIHYACHNPVYDEYYIIPTNSSYSADASSNRMIVLDHAFSIRKTILLEPFYAQNYSGGPGYTTTDARGEYLFVSSDGNNVVVVSKKASSSTYWGIEVIDRSW